MTISNLTKENLATYKVKQCESKKNTWKRNEGRNHGWNLNQMGVIIFFLIYFISFCAFFY